MRVLILLLASCLVAQGEVAFEWVTVGNPGNPPDVPPLSFEHGFGSVGYEFQISKYEVTNAQYAEFLNAVGSEDLGIGPPGDQARLYGSMDEIVRFGSMGDFSYEVRAGLEARPVNGVSFLRAARFANWLENGQPSGPQSDETTEAGVYEILSFRVGPRNSNATFFVPTEDEWYKAAFHDPNASGEYWAYATMSNDTPLATLPPGGPNSVNASTLLARNPNSGTTDVGSYPESPSFYGTFDQAGNLWEWTESFFRDSDERVLRGGDWQAQLEPTATMAPGSFRPDGVSPEWGFRVARTIPEPTCIIQLILAFSLTAFRRFR